MQQPGKCNSLARATAPSRPTAQSIGFEGEGVTPWGEEGVVVSEGGAKWQDAYRFKAFSKSVQLNRI
jgi:hypothetical protein